MDCQSAPRSRREVGSGYCRALITHHPRRLRQNIKRTAPAANSTSVPGSGTGVMEGEAASGWSSRELTAPVSDPAPVGPPANAEASPMVKLEPPASASLFVRINVPLATTVPPVKPLLPLRISVPASFNKSEPLPESALAHVAGDLQRRAGRGRDRETARQGHVGRDRLAAAGDDDLAPRCRPRWPSSGCRSETPGVSV